MIPKTLTIQGLYSYKTRQTIRFDALMKQHLFGIFGPVGSGKSSILDAITFALYAEMERISTKEGRAQHIFNRESDEFLIDFEFEAGADNQRYRFVVKNARKKTGEAKSFDRSAYQWLNGNWVPLQISTAESIFNLSYENFKRTIIIPQGKFQEFFSLNGAERNHMMKELFPRLAEFDLVEKTRRKLNETKLELSNLEGQLLGLGAVDEAELERIGQAILKLESEIESDEKKLLDLEKELEKFRQWNQWLRDLETAKSRLNELLPLEASNKKKKEELEEYNRMAGAFQADFRLLDKAISDGIKVKEQLNQILKTAAELKEKANDCKQKAEDLAPVAQALPELERKLTDWEKAAKIKTLWAQSHERSTELKAKDQEIQQQKVQKEELLTSRAKWRSAIDNLEDEAKDLQELMQAKQALEERQKKEGEIQDLKRRLHQNEQAVQSLKEEKDKLLQAATWKNMPQFRAELKLDELLMLIAETRKEVQAEKGKLEIKRRELDKQDHLFQFSNAIKEGEPCPLCGSTHHPQVISADDVSSQKAQNDTLIQSKSELLENLARLEVDLSALKSDLRNLINEKGMLENQQNALQEFLSTQTKNLQANPFAQADLVSIEQSLKAKALQAESLKKAREQYRDADRQLEMLDARMAEMEVKKSKLDNELAAISGQIEVLRSQISSLKPNEWETLQEDEISSQIDRLNLQLEKDRSAVEKANQELLAVQQELDQILTSENIFTQQAQQLESELADLQAVVDAKLGQLGKSEAYVREILKKNLESGTLSQELDLFFNELALAKEQLAIAEAKTSGISMDAQKEQDAEVRLQSEKKLLSEKKEQLGALKANAHRMSESLKKIREIEGNQKRLSERKENLDTLNKLFMGNALVNFASSHYLKNIVEMANERFFKMTKQRLRLELDPQNNFFVKDYLNEGHTRLAKTLSGGQTFQASLCLALALADSIGHITQSTKSFFFLDEGFGSLDKDALGMVFDTLRQLQSENRTVGIISHVEELQQEISLYADIHLDPEKGSQVRYSFNAE